MARRKSNKRKENALVRYFRDTLVELRKVRWPTREQAFALTKIVGLVTLGMAILLGALDLFFGWVVRGIIDQNVWFMVGGALVAAVLVGAGFWIGQGEEG
jgi:preprotein translocase subunit SecE